MYVSAQNWALFFLSPNFEDVEQIDIKDISGAILLTTLPNEGCKRKFTLMKEDYIMLKFSLENPIYFKLGSYVECNFGLFEVCDLQKPAFNTNTAGYDYELRLDAYYWKWKNKIFKYTPEVAGQEASWNLTASLDVQAGIVLRNLKALGYTYKGQDFVFSIDSTVENKSQLMSYDNINILDACFSMAKKWDCECWVTENIIHFGRCESGDAVDFEIGKNVQEMPRSESRSTYATRIYAFGSTKNIPSDYRPVDETVVLNGVVQKRLMLPEGTPYIDAYPDMTTEEAIEQVVIFDDVYPRRVGTMSDITIKEYTDKIENADGTTTEKKWNAYRFKDTGITFSKDYILPGKELKITFQSGKLNGMEFAVTFDPEGKPEKLGNGGWNPEAQLWEIVRNEDYGRPLPDGALIPENGDTYILSGWNSMKITEMGLVAEAQLELKDKADKYVAKSKIDPSTYNCKMMSDVAYSEDGIHNLYSIGQKVNLINKAYFENGRQSRVIGFEFNLDLPYDSPIYTVGETAAYSRIGELPELVQKVKTAYDGLLDMKREEVAENIRQCMQDVHQLASEARDAGALLRQADDHFVNKREAAKTATSLTELDAMITQLLNYKDTICRRMEVMSASRQQEAQKPTPAAPAKPGAPAPKPPKIMTVRRYDLCSVKRLQNKEDIDKYVEAIREKLMKTLESCDGVQIN